MINRHSQYQKKTILQSRVSIFGQQKGCDLDRGCLRIGQTCDVNIDVNDHIICCDQRELRPLCWQDRLGAKMLDRLCIRVDGKYSVEVLQTMRAHKDRHHHIAPGISAVFYPGGIATIRQTTHIGAYEV